MALLVNYGIEASTHKGVIRMISGEFVRKGILPEEYSRLLGRLFTMRQTGDYEDLFDWEEADVLPLIPKVKDYIRHVAELIDSDKKS